MAKCNQLTSLPFRWLVVPAIATASQATQKPLTDLHRQCYPLEQPTLTHLTPYLCLSGISQKFHT